MYSFLVRTRTALLALTISFLLVSLFSQQAWGSYYVGGDDSFEYSAQESRDPEANLPVLYAVYSITWAAFFGYLFLVSRRQRDMRREIEALRKALEEKNKKEEAKESE